MNDDEDEFDRQYRLAEAYVMSPEEQARSDQMIAVAHEKQRQRDDATNCLSAVQRDIALKLYTAVSMRRAFPCGEWKGVQFFLTGHYMRRALRGHRSDGQQARTRDFINRFVALHPARDYTNILQEYTGGEGEFFNQQPERTYRRRRSNGGLIGRPRKYPEGEFRKTSLILSNEQFDAIKAQYGTIQNGINQLTARTVALYNQRRQQQ